MVNEEILGGIRNALERGSSLERAVQSFINAGYNPQEVQEAAAQMTYGASSIMQAQATSQPSPMPAGFSTSPQQQVQPQQNKPSFGTSLSSMLASMDQGTKILVIGVVIILLLVFGALAFLLLRG